MLGVVFVHATFIACFTFGFRLYFDPMEPVGAHNVSWLRIAKMAVAFPGPTQHHSRNNDRDLNDRLEWHSCAVTGFHNDGLWKKMRSDFTRVCNIFRAQAFCAPPNGLLLSGSKENGVFTRYIGWARRAAGCSRKGGASPGHSQHGLSVGKGECFLRVLHGKIKWEKRVTERKCVKSFQLRCC